MKAIVPERLAAKLKELYGEDTLKDVIILGDGDRLVFWTVEAGRRLGRRPVPISTQAVRELREDGLSWREVARRLRCDWRTARERVKEEKHAYRNNEKD